MESNLPSRGTTRLQYHRTSIAGARYFVTICVRNRINQLVDSGLNNQLIAQLEDQEKVGDFVLLCGTVMPDHLHVVLRLGDRISLSQTIAKFKSKTKGLASWQDNYYEHRIRSEESEERYAFYVFMNPFVEELCEFSEKWSWWKRWRSIPYEFEELLVSDESIPIQWIEKERSIRQNISI